jgi:hypothetical protein
MTHIPIQLPFKGFTEQSQFSAIPAGMTPSCVNMMPSDVWNGRTRISTRNGTKLFNLGGVQFVSTFRAYIGGALVERLIFVRAGKVYYADPRSGLTATATVFPGQGTALLNTTGIVEGVLVYSGFPAKVVAMNHPNNSSTVFVVEFPEENAGRVEGKQ